MLLDLTAFFFRQRRNRFIYWYKYKIQLVHEDTDFYLSYTYVTLYIRLLQKLFIYLSLNDPIPIYYILYKIHFDCGHLL